MVEKLYDRVRKKWVKALPEEVVRQRLLALMIEQLGFPQELLAVEINLRDLPHVRCCGESIPDRRADIICFSKEGPRSDGIFPLLLVECKAVPLSEKVISQVVGYNYSVQASFIAVANESEVRVGWYDMESNEYQFVEGLPSYRELLLSLA